MGNESITCTDSYKISSNQQSIMALLPHLYEFKNETKFYKNGLIFFFFSFPKCIIKLKDNRDENSK